MKILKPGKVEMRKFVCPDCGCEFVGGIREADPCGWVKCPQGGCRGGDSWENGEPYEEPADAANPDRKWVERLIFEQLGGKRNYSPRLTDYFLQNSGPGKEE